MLRINPEILKRKIKIQKEKKWRQSIKTGSRDCQETLGFFFASGTLSLSVDTYIKKKKTLSLS